MNKDIYCENSKEYKFIKKLLDIKLLMKEPVEFDYPILIYEAQHYYGHGKRWLYIENVKKSVAESHIKIFIFAKHIIRKQKLNRINKDV